MIISPAQDGCICLFGLEPHFRRVGAGAGRIGRNRFATVDSLAHVEVPALADNAGSSRGARILRFNRADLILYRVIHVPHAEIAVGLIEYRLAIRLAGGISLAPI